VAALEAFKPAGRVLELACGTGQWTAELTKRASGVTAVDSSPEMLAINKAKVSQDNLRHVEADLFRWSHAARYDVVFFSAWPSHVPPQLFDDFWRLVPGCWQDTGRVFVIDELPAVDATERRVPGTQAPAVERPRNRLAVLLRHRPTHWGPVADRLR
jgi:SAM-dependent methyltransferase